LFAFVSNEMVRLATGVVATIRPTVTMVRTAAWPYTRGKHHGRGRCGGGYHYDEKSVHHSQYFNSSGVCGGHGGRSGQNDYANSQSDDAAAGQRGRGRGGRDCGRGGGRGH
jgi:hypothetical protein